MNDNNKFNISIIDVIAIIETDWRKLMIYSCIAGVIGLIFAFTTPKVYKSSVMLAPEESGAGFSGSLSSLASMVGMNMKIGQTGDALYPEIYPDLVGSTDFTIALFDARIEIPDRSIKCDYYTYIKDHQKNSLTDYPKAALVYILEKFKSEPTIVKPSKQDNGPIVLTKKQYDIAQAISGNIKCQVDKKTNVITITVQDQEPMIAAVIADTVKQHLQRAITEYRTKKAKVDLEYMQRLFDQARAEYDRARQVYASYADANQEVNLQSFKLKEEDLENDMQLKYNIYQQVVEQLQLAKAKVQERTPAFTVMQSAIVPVKHSNTPKVITLLVWMILGLATRCAILFVKEFKKS